MKTIIRALISVFLLVTSAVAAPRSSITRQGDYAIRQIVVPDFDKLSLSRKMYVYYLSQAAEAGRDIVWRQLSRDGIAVRNLVEGLYKYANTFSPIERAALEEYIYQVQREHGLYNVNKNTKITPPRSLSFSKMLEMAKKVDTMTEDSKKTAYAKELTRLRKAIFDPNYFPYFEITDALVATGLDRIADSGSNFYGPGVTAAGMEALPVEQREHFLSRPELDEKGNILLRLHKIGENNDAELRLIDHYLGLAAQYGNEQEKEIIRLERLVLRTGDPAHLRAAEVAWVKYKSHDIDFRIGFIESYADPMGIRGYWESYITLAKQDPVTKERHNTVRSNAHVFESLMPVDPEFKKAPGFTPPEAESVYFVFLGGEVGEAPPGGINLPNEQWIRENHGSKSVTAENTIADVGGTRKVDLKGMRMYYDPQHYDAYKSVDHALSRSIQVEFHEILGHGSGRMRDGVTDGAFGNIYSAMEEARAEVASLYHMSDFIRLRDLGIYPKSYSDQQAEDIATYQIVEFFTSQLRSYAARLADTTTEITQAHQLGRQAMLNWMVHENALEIVTAKSGIPHVRLNDIAAARASLGRFWNEIQNMKSKGLVDETRAFFKRWGAYTEQHKTWRKAILAQMNRQGSPKNVIYLNPTMKLVKNAAGAVVDVKLTYSNASKGMAGVVQRQIEVSARNAARVKTLLPKIEKGSCEPLLVGDGQGETAP